MVKPPLRTKTVGTKLSEKEYAQLEVAARERGLTVSEWCRTVLLASGNGHATKSAEPTGSDQALMAELVALRTILLNLHCRIASTVSRVAENAYTMAGKMEWKRVVSSIKRLAQGVFPCLEGFLGHVVLHGLAPAGIFLWPGFGEAAAQGSWSSYLLKPYSTHLRNPT